MGLLTRLLPVKAKPEESTSLVKLDYDPRKPTVQITPHDRKHMIVVASRAADVLIHTYHDEIEARRISRTWLESLDPEFVYPEIAKYMNIELIPQGDYYDQVEVNHEIHS